MENTQKKLELLARKIIALQGNCSIEPILWREQLELFNKSLNLISELIDTEQLSNEENFILRKLTEELIRVGGIPSQTSERDLISYKRKCLYEVTLDAEAELQRIPVVEKKEPEIKTLNDWISYLSIFKVDNCFLSLEIYPTSDDLHHAMRQIILNKKAPLYKKIYLGRIVDKLDNEENKSRLPQGIRLEVADYELGQLIRLVKNNPEFNYRLMERDYHKLLINERLIHTDWANRLLLLVKK